MTLTTLCGKATMDKITVRQARKLELTQAEWIMSETPEGWIVKCGEATLISDNSRQTRYFSDLNRAIPRLKRDLGIRSIKVLTTQ